MFFFLLLFLCLFPRRCVAIMERSFYTEFMTREQEKLSKLQNDEENNGRARRIEGLIRVRKQ